MFLFVILVDGNKGSLEHTTAEIVKIRRQGNRVCKINKCKIYLKVGGY
jgi:hypothetical protein